jgi:SAM-dependent methyltransferase
MMVRPREAAMDDTTKHALYDQLAPWYRLLDPTEDHADEAAIYQAAFEGAIGADAQTLLELGAGAGNNAFYLKQRFRCTLTDPAPAMLELSRALNPGCEHLPGDMRSLRTGRTFDAVLLHDAVVYMLDEPQLRAAAETAFVHTRSGGAALFAPDYVREAFEERSEHYQCRDGTRAMRCIEWMWDPDPDDTSYQVDYAFLLRDEGGVRAVHDRHVEGLFARATWLRLLADVGFEVRVLPGAVDDLATHELFVCRRP